MTDAEMKFWDDMHLIYCRGVDLTPECVRILLEMGRICLATNLPYCEMGIGYWADFLKRSRRTAARYLTEAIRKSELLSERRGRLPVRYYPDSRWIGYAGESHR